MEGDIVSEFRESVDIAASPETVWRLVTDLCRHPEYAGPKSITKVVEYEGEVAVGRRFLAHERFGLQKFDASSDITVVDPWRRFEWLTFPPMKEDARGRGGKVLWGYELDEVPGGTRLTHYMSVLEPRKGAGALKAMYRLFRLRAKQRTGGLTSLGNIKAAAQQQVRPI